MSDTYSYHIVNSLEPKDSYWFDHKTQYHLYSTIEQLESLLCDSYLKETSQLTLESELEGIHACYIFRPQDILDIFDRSWFMVSFHFPNTGAYNNIIVTLKYFRDMLGSKEVCQEEFLTSLNRLAKDTASHIQNIAECRQ